MKTLVQVCKNNNCKKIQGRLWYHNFKKTWKAFFYFLYIVLCYANIIAMNM